MSRIAELAGSERRNGKSIRRASSTRVRSLPIISNCATGLLNAKTTFARGFTEAVIAYSLGRPFGFIDEDLALGIMSSAKNKNYALREFVHALVQAKRFQSK